jgi:hypothetical protein
VAVGDLIGGLRCVAAVDSPLRVVSPPIALRDAFGQYLSSTSIRCSFATRAICDSLHCWGLRCNRGVFLFAAGVISRILTTAPPKPSAQSALLLDAMASSDQHHEDQLRSIMDSLDLLFQRVSDVNTAQQQFKAQLDLNSQAIHQCTTEQQFLSKQVTATGQAVSELQLAHSEVSDDEVEHNPFHSQSTPPFRHFHQHQSGRTPHSYGGIHQPGRSPLPRGALPNLSFPKFDGTHPKIWKEKCLDYFHIFDIHESMWVTAASLHFEDKAAKWLQVYRKQHGITLWPQFVTAVEQQFGSHEFRDALTELTELSQTGSVEEYTAQFESLQFDVAMHNTAYDELFFVNHFTRGLKPEIRDAVQSQVPDTMHRAIMLARIHQRVLDRTKAKFRKLSSGKSSSVSSFPKSESRPSSSSTLWRERQIRDYRKAHGLCFHCGEKFDPTHVASCPKRGSAQVHAVALNDLDQPLSEDILNQLAVEDSLTEDFGQLSLNAISRTDDTECLRLCVLVHNKVLLLLVDSGSSHSFLNSSVLNLLGIPTLPTRPQQSKKKIQSGL